MGFCTHRKGHVHAWRRMRVLRRRLRCVPRSMLERARNDASGMVLLHTGPADTNLLPMPHPAWKLCGSSRSGVARSPRRRAVHNPFITDLVDGLGVACKPSTDTECKHKF